MIDFNDSIFAVQIYGYSLSKTFLRKNGYSFKISLLFIFKKVSVQNKTEEIEFISLWHTHLHLPFQNVRCVKYTSKRVHMALLERTVC